MADTQHIRRTVKAVEKVKTWQLAVVLLMAVFVAATFLRLNNIGMIERRDAVYAADEAGDAAQLQRRLYDLQRFVSAHMNTDPGRIALERSYQRDNDRLKEEYMARQSDSPYGNVYKQAADVCDPIGQAQGWRWPDVRYTNCIDQELSKYPDASQSQGQFKPLPPEAHTSALGMMLLTYSTPAEYWLRETIRSPLVTPAGVRSTYQPRLPTMSLALDTEKVRVR